MTTEVKPTGALGLTTSRAANRPARKKLHDPGRCKFADIPGYKTRLVNSAAKYHSHRVQAYKEAWWEPVLQKEVFGPNCENPNDLVKVNDPDEPMLMKIPIDLYQEDMKEFHTENDRIYHERINKRDPGQFGSISVSDAVQGL